MLRGIRCILVVAILTLAGSAQTNVTAIAIDHSDPKLKWGVCPPLFPKGCEIAVLNGDPARNDADILLKVPGNYEIPHHWHSSSERMVLVSGKLKVTYDGMPPVDLKPGMYAFGPAKLPHKAFCSKGDPCVLFIAFDLPVDAQLVERGPK